MNPELALESVQQTLILLIPEILLLLAAIALMTASPFVRATCRTWGWLAVGSLAVTFLALLALKGRQADLYSAAALNDDLGFYGRLVIVLTGFIILALAHDEPADDRAGEFFGALLMINAGAMLVATANDLILLFVGLELVSMPTYLLLYLTRRTITTQESATKYFYLSIFSSGMLLFGMAYLYGLAGISNLKALAAVAASLPGIPHQELGLIAVLFILAGLSFRVAAVPFHFYAPDVYQGSPTVIAALLSWIPKAVGFVAMVRTLTAVVSVKGLDDPLVQKAVMISWVIAAATMTLGNTVALLQTDLKRLLAYSSIAHAGYLMIGVTVAFANGPRGASLYYGCESIFFYLVAYALMTLGAFGAIIALTAGDRPVETVEDLAGLGSTQPLPALAMAVCLLSLSGIPPLAGFWGKLEIFTSAFAATPDETSRLFFLLAVIGVLNAAVGAYYYLRIVVNMYLRPARLDVKARGGWPVALAVGGCATLTVLIGLFPGPLARAAHAAALAAVSHPTSRVGEIALGQAPTAAAVEIRSAAAAARD